MTKRALQAQETKAHIIETAIRLFAEKTFDGVTVDMITQEAGVAKGSFYHYFKTKDDIAAYIIYETFRKLYEEMRKPGKNEPKQEVSAIGKLKRWLGTIYGLIEQQGFGYIRHGHIKMAPNKADKGYHRADLFILDLEIVGNILEKAVKAGEFKQSTPIEDLKLQIVSTAYGLCNSSALKNSVEALRQGLEFYGDTLSLILKHYRNN
jgi:AcrR family transcriptional regulator